MQSKYFPESKAWNIAVVLNKEKQHMPEQVFLLDVLRYQDVYGTKVQTMKLQSSKSLQKD